MIVVEYKADPSRQGFLETGIYVRGRGFDGKWASVDIAHLDITSLNAWLRSRNNIDWPVNTVLMLLGHDPSLVRQEDPALAQQKLDFGGEPPIYAGPWHANEDGLLRTLFAAGRSAGQIAKALCRTEEAVTLRAVELGLFAKA